MSFFNFSRFAKTSLSDFRKFFVKIVLDKLCTPRILIQTKPDSEVDPVPRFSVVGSETLTKSKFFLESVPEQKSLPSIENIQSIESCCFSLAAVMLGTMCCIQD